MLKALSVLAFFVAALVSAIPVNTVEPTASFPVCDSGETALRLYVKFTSGTSNDVEISGGTLGNSSAVFPGGADIRKEFCIGSGKYKVTVPTSGAASFVVLVSEDSEVVFSDSVIGFNGVYNKEFVYRRIVSSPTVAPTSMEDYDIMNCPNHQRFVRVNASQYDPSVASDVFWDVRALNSVSSVIRGTGSKGGEACLSCGMYVFDAVNVNGNGLGTGQLGVHLDAIQMWDGTGFSTGHSKAVYLEVDCSCYSYQTQLKVVINADKKPYETAWSVLKLDGPDAGLVASREGSLGDFECLNPGEYLFEMYDRGGNGMCCDDGNGQFALFLDGKFTHYGGKFGYYDKYRFTIPSK